MVTCNGNVGLHKECGEIKVQIFIGQANLQLCLSFN